MRVVPAGNLMMLQEVLTHGQASKTNPEQLEIELHEIDGSLLAMPLVHASGRLSLTDSCCLASHASKAFWYNQVCTYPVLAHQD